MSKLYTVGSSSAANGYILSAGDENLIIEAGCKIKEYLAALKYDLSCVTAVLVSHAHSDHARSIEKLQDYGLSVYAPPSVCEIHPKCKCVEHLHKYKIGGFTVMPLKVEHNVECFGYVIDHADMPRICFFTDTRSFNYKIPNCGCILGEVNYSDDVILDNLCEGHDIRSQYDNHMSLDTAISVIRRLYSPKLSKVICCHLSDSNADENAIKRRFKEELGLDVLIAESGLTVDLKEDDF